MRRRFLLAALLLPCTAFAQQIPSEPSSQDSTSAVTLTVPQTGTSSQDSTSAVTLSSPQTGNNPLVIAGLNGKSLDLAPISWNVPETRVTLDLENASLSDALKSICTQAKQQYEIEKGVPEDAHITVHAKNIRFETALDLITQAAGVGWSHDLDLSREIDPKRSGKASLNSLHSRYRITKAQRTNRFPSLFNSDTKPNTVFWNSGTGNAFTYGNSNGQSLYQLLEPEHRSTFTCPHCKGTVTVVRRQEAPKCPKCGRTFQADWQFCPVDGTRRPQDPGEWKFCPLCGKPIDIEKDKAEKDGSSMNVPTLSTLPVIGRLFQKENQPTP